MKKVDEEIAAVRDVIEYRLTLTFPNGIPVEQKRPICLEIYASDYEKFDLDQETFSSILYVIRERGIVAPNSRPTESEDFINDERYQYADAIPMFFVYLKEGDTQPGDTTPAPIKAIESKDIIYSLATNSRSVVLNGHILRTPHFDGLNHRFYGYMLLHPNETFSKVKIEQELNMKIAKRMVSIIEDLGFEGEIKKMFFDVSKDSVRLRNPILSQDIEHMNLKKIDLAEYVEKIHKKGDRKKK